MDEHTEHTAPARALTVGEIRRAKLRLLAIDVESRKLAVNGAGIRFLSLQAEREKIVAKLLGDPR